MDGWTEAGWMDGRVDVWLGGQTDRQTDRQTDIQTDRQTDRRGKDVCVHSRVYAWMDVWVDGQTGEADI